jgi:hypothetical protein
MDKKEVIMTAENFMAGVAIFISVLSLLVSAYAIFRIDK